VKVLALAIQQPLTPEIIIMQLATFGMRRTLILMKLDKCTTIYFFMNNFLYLKEASPWVAGILRKQIFIIFMILTHWKLDYKIKPNLSLSLGPELQ